MSASLPSQQCIMFDLDGTLSPSKSVMSASMAARFTALLEKRTLAVISGGTMEQFKTQFLSAIDTPRARLENLFLLPTSGAAMYRWDGSAWQAVYQELLSPAEGEKVRKEIEKAVALSGIEVPKTLYGEPLENRGSQITFSWFGQHAPIEVKQPWDPNYEKRKLLVSLLTPGLPGFSIVIGGMTSIDITKSGIDKAYGIRKLADFLQIDTGDILYVGDAIFEGGNDYAAVTAGATTRPVSDPTETEALIASWLAT